MDAPEQHKTDAPGSHVHWRTRRLRELFDTPLPVSDEEQADRVRDSGNPDLPHLWRPLTDTEIADRIGCSAKYVGQMRSGSQHDPSDKFLKRIARLYGRSVEWLSDPSWTLVPARHPLTRKLRILFATPLPVSDERLAELRRLSGNPRLARVYEPLSNAEIARRTKRTATYIGLLKDGDKTNPSLDLLQAFANLYNQPIGALVTPQADFDASTMSQRVASLFLAVDGDGAQSIRFTPEAVEAEIGVDAEQLRSLCDGTLSADEVPVSMPAKLAEFFGVSLRYLLGGISDPAEEAATSTALHWLQDLNNRGTLAAAFRRVGEIKDDTSRERLESAVATVVDAFVAMEQQSAQQPQRPPGSPGS